MSLFVPWAELEAPHPAAELSPAIPRYPHISCAGLGVGGHV